MKKLLTFFSMAMIALASSAQTSVTVDGIKYILDGSNATVTYLTDDGNEPGSKNLNNYTGSIVIPATITVDDVTCNVTAIGKKAFRSSTITSISLPEGLLSIGKEAICKTNITEITVPNSVTTLEQYAIGQNSKLKTIYIGESGGGSTWGEWVFWRSSGGYDVYMVCDIMPTLPDEYTFDDSHASKIYVKPELVDQFKADQWWGQHTILPFGTEYIDFTVDGIKYTQTADDEVSLTYATDGKPGSSNPNTYSGDFVVPAQVTYEGKTYNVTGIDNYAFRKAAITSIALPEGLVSIGEEAIYDTQITEITLPNTLTTTGQYAIANNQKLTTITCGKGSDTKEWGRWVFWRASTAYDVYMICDTKPEVPDIYTFDNDFASTIHVYPSAYLDYTKDYHWNCYNIVADLVQEISHEDLQNAIANFSAQVPADEEVGTDPGFYSSASVQALKDALAAASALDESATTLQRNEAFLQMKVAANALLVNPLNEGYYYIENVYKERVLYTSPSEAAEGGLKGKKIADFDGSAKYYFKLTHKGGNWIMQSCDADGMYIGAPIGGNENGKYISLTENPEYAQVITWAGGGKFTIQSLYDGTNASYPYSMSTEYTSYAWVYDYAGTDDEKRIYWSFHPAQSGTFEQDFNIENIRVREYMAEVTYTKGEETKIKPYNVAPPVRRDVPEPATIFWNQNASATAQQVVWSLNADFTDAFTAEVSADNTFYEIYNLLPNQTYYYKVIATVEGEPTEIINSSFTTNGQLRQIYAEGTGNVRDLGGWQTVSGKPIKYGLIYRGAEWNGEYNLTSEGIAALRAIGLKAELDLRIDYEAAYITKSPLGDDVIYKRITNEDYYESGMQNRKDLYKQNLDFVFDCVKNDKPVYFHCHIGADRTGTLGVILEGLLGVSESDLYKEYELTTFSYYETHRYKENIDGILEYINTLDGETLMDKFYTYVNKELGISAKDIADFRQKMLGVVYPADIKNLVSEALREKATSIDLSNYSFEADALVGSMPDGSNLLITVSPESGITGTNIINNGVCESLILTDGSDFGAPYAFTAANASYMTQVDSYRTLILPFEATVPVEFTASKAISVTGTTVNLSAVASVSANRPVLVQGDGLLVLTATDVAVPATTTKLAEGLLRGVYKSTAAEEGSYVLQNQNGVTGFYQVADVKPTINAFRAYLEVPVSNVKVYFFNEGATGISFSPTLSNDEAEVFNLVGQRLSKMQKGVNIVNGKKILK